ncbi:hypothetical protein MML48_1g16986 [Holotrichia oblita]|uniref:Uncharacterized protein n=1 Tax=Holotrichia oblita TaxID=644536 RepID=A0ACB9TV57_HOLOL|nr:hypothetical protein MML48_1g16986 [Holotrichia oblita]
MKTCIVFTSKENVEWSLQVIHDVASRSLGELCVTQRFCSLSVPLDTAKFDPARQKADLAATLLQDLGVGHHNGVRECHNMKNVLFKILEFIRLQAKGILSNEMNDENLKQNATPSTSFHRTNTSGALLTSEHNFSFVNIPEFIPNPSFDVPRVKVAKSLGGTNIPVLAVSKKSLVTSQHGKTKNQQDIMKVLMAIRQQNAQVIEQNQNILSSFGINSNNAMLNFHLPVELPVTNSQELMSLENYINSMENFKSFVAFLVKLGGKDITSKTNRMLKTILTDTEAKNYNFYGKRGLKKAFSVLKLRSAIVGE